RGDGARLRVRRGRAAALGARAETTDQHCGGSPGRPTTAERTPAARSLPTRDAVPGRQSLARPGLPRLLELLLEVAEAALELRERRLHPSRAPDDVVELAAELIALLLDVREAMLEVLHRVGPRDDEVRGSRLHGPERRAGAEHEAEQQREQEARHTRHHPPFRSPVASASRPISRTTTWSAARLGRGAARRS